MAVEVERIAFTKPEVEYLRSVVRQDLKRCERNLKKGADKHGEAFDPTRIEQRRAFIAHLYARLSGKEEAQ